MENLEKYAKEMKEILNLETEPVAVFLLRDVSDESVFSEFKELENHRYCQALMRARRGEAVKLTKDKYPVLLRRGHLDLDLCRMD